MKPTKKAYRINQRNLDLNHESIVRGYLDYFYADNEKQARKIALKECEYNGIETDYNDEPLTYISIKVYREPSKDKFLVDGQLKTKKEIESDKRRSDRNAGFRKLLEENPEGMAFIKKGGYYYRKNYSGYTEHRTDAGVYTLAQAVRECLGMSESEYMRPELIDIAEHNKMILEKIEELKTRLITLNQEA